MIAIWTHEGTIIVFDPEIGTVAARSEHEAWREVERRKAKSRNGEQFRCCELAPRSG
ncbi:hypothetical protein [Mesorhizobium waimense]|uniref:hypothetical protein n=1 Tax=Mesorhizobium waimense TaxID=1300307 RepID=UPI00142DEC96|nr:hypothetical protein [Mesorhizobium waimense]